MLANDGIGLVRFNDAAQRIMEVEDAGAAPGGTGRTHARTHIDSNELDPSGSTSIGDGVVKGRRHAERRPGRAHAGLRRHGDGRADRRHVEHAAAAVGGLRQHQRVDLCRGPRPAVEHQRPGADHALPRAQWLPADHRRDHLQSVDAAVQVLPANPRRRDQRADCSRSRGRARRARPSTAFRSGSARRTSGWTRSSSVPSLSSSTSSSRPPTVR